MKKLLEIFSVLVLTFPVINGLSSFSILAKKEPVSSIYQKQNYQAKINLDEVLINTNLGIINKINSQAILVEVKIKNPNVYIEELEVKNIGIRSAQILVKSSSQHYFQTFLGVTVLFEIKTKVELTKVLINTDLGEIENNKDLTILSAIKKINTNILLDNISVFPPSILNNSALIRANENGAYTGEVIVTYRIKKKHLVSDLPNQNLGFLKNNDKITLERSLMEENPNLKLVEVEIKNIQESSFEVQVKPTSSTYLPNEIVKIFFDMPAHSIKDDLNLKINNFTIVIQNNSLKEINKALTKRNIVINEVLIFNITNNSFKIQAKEDSHFYRLESPITLGMIVPTESIKKDLNKVNLNLGSLLFNDVKSIRETLERITILNMDEVEIFDITKTSFKIQAKEDSPYYLLEKEITFNFILMINLKSEIGDFKWIKDRTKEQMLNEINTLIQEKSNFKISKGIDYTITYLDNIANGIVPRQTYTVKANSTSKYLVGDFSITFIDSIDFNEFSVDYEYQLSVLVLDTKWFDNNDINIIEEQFQWMRTTFNNNVNKWIKDQHIKEQIDLLGYENPNNGLPVFFLEPQFNLEDFYPLIHEETKLYVRKIDFVYNGPNNDLFRSSRADGKLMGFWTNLAVPVERYDIPFNDQVAVSFIDNTGDLNYPYKNKYLNDYHSEVSWETWQHSKEIIFAEIDVESSFNVKTVKEFFDLYWIDFSWKWIGNIKVGDSWLRLGNKNIPENEWWVTNENLIAFTGSNNYGSKFANGWTLKDRPLTHFTKYDTTDFGSEAIHIWMEAEGTKIYIKGETAALYYSSTWASNKRAVYTYLKGRELNIFKKS